MQPAACESPQELLMRASEFLRINKDRHGAGDSLVAASGIDHDGQRTAVPEADLHYAVLDYLEKGNIQTAATLLEADIGKIVTPG